MSLYNQIRKSFLYILIFLLSGTSLVHADRAMWVWSMADDIVMEQNIYDRDNFFSFVSAPHGDPDAAITTLFMCIPSSTIQTYPARVAEFISDAHSRNLNIEFLSGDVVWALTETNPATGTPYNQPATDEVQLITDFNSAHASNERFDGIQMDVEPYLMSQDKGHPYNWSQHDDRAIIWTQYIDSITLWQNMVYTHNTSTADDMIFGMAIPNHWDVTDNAPAQQSTVQDIVDYIAIMDYDTRDELVLSRVTNELFYGHSSGYSNNIYVGLETIEISWRESNDPDAHFLYYYMRSCSFHDLTISNLESTIDLVETNFNPEINQTEFYSSYKGIAIHYYENISNHEYSYRNMDAINTNHAPACHITYPAEGTIKTGNIEILYTMFDLDRDELIGELQISDDNGASWSNIPPDLLSMPLTPGQSFTILDATSLNPGTNYLLKLNVTETGASGLTTYDTMDSPFTISTTITDTNAPSSESASISIVTEHPTHHVLFTWTGWTETGMNPSGIQGYFYTMDNENLYSNNTHFTRSSSAVLPVSTPGEHTIFVWAIDCAGNISAPYQQTFTALSDMDNDGTADNIDNDMDGDGISNAEESAALTRANDSQHFSYDKIAALWEFDDTNAPLKDSLYRAGPLTVTSGFVTYTNTDRFYTGDNAMKIDASTTTYLYHYGDLLAATEELTAMTIEMWIKPESDMRYSPLTMIGDLDLGLSLILRDNKKRICFRCYNASSPTSGQYTSLQHPNNTLFDGQWHHIAANYNGSEHTLKLYIDGALVAKRLSGKIPDSLGMGSTFTGNRRLRFFNTESIADYDTATGSPRYGYGQFGNNINWDWADSGAFNYTGLIDDIRITLADLPQYRLGYYVHPVAENVDQDTDGIDDMLETIIYQSNTSSPDTDNDGLSDNDEINLYSTDPSNNDTDTDGMTDKWEIDHFADITTASNNTDNDDDQFIDLHEALAGTNPQDPDSYLGINAQHKNTDTITLQWQSESNRTYRIAAASQLTGIFDMAISNNIPATPPINTCIINTPSQDAVFYRIELE